MFQLDYLENLKDHIRKTPDEIFTHLFYNGKPLTKDFLLNDHSLLERLWISYQKAVANYQASTQPFDIALREIFGESAVQKKPYMLQVIEQNVDGCGSNASIFVQATKPLNDADIMIFEYLLTSSKETHSADDFSTEDFVNDAIQRFNERDKMKSRGITLSTVPEPYDKIITF